MTDPLFPVAATSEMLFLDLPHVERVRRHHIAAVMALGALVTGTGGCASIGAQPGQAPPQASAASTSGAADDADALPADLAALVDELMTSFATALPALAPCLDDVTVQHRWELADRAEYRPATATVLLRVPATAPQLRTSLAHELAHHVDATCLDDDLRARFAATQGLGQRPWSGGAAWEDVPAEHFAIAVAEAVTGRRDPLRSVAITPAAAAFVRELDRTG